MWLPNTFFLDAHHAEAKKQGQEDSNRTGERARRWFYELSYNQDKPAFLEAKKMLFIKVPKISFEQSTLKPEKSNRFRRRVRL